MNINLLNLENIFSVVNQRLDPEYWVERNEFQETETRFRLINNSIQNISRHGLRCDGNHIYYIKWKEKYIATNQGDFCSPLCLFETIKDSLDSGDPDEE